VRLEIEDSLASVIEAWRATRHARLADLADALDEKLGESVKVEELAATDDPRLARAIMRLLERPPSKKSRKMLQMVFGALARGRDRRVIGLARELAGRYLSIAGTATGLWVLSQLEAIAAELEKAPPPAELSAELAADCAALEARLGVVFVDHESVARREAASRRAVDDLAAVVYRDPDSDDARLVFADALIERGDERGEMISLQIASTRGRATAEQQARADELVARHGADWAQPLSKAGACRFARGFPISVELFVKPAPEAVGSPAWATVERVIGFERVPNKLAAEILNGAPLVTDVGVLGASLFRLLGDAERPWTKLAIQAAYDLRVETLRVAPRVEELVLREMNRVPPEALLRPLAGLRKLAVDIRTPFPPGFFDGLPALRDLSVDFTYEPGGSFPRSLTRLAMSLSYRWSLERFMDELPALRELVLDVEFLSVVRGIWPRLPALESLELHTTDPTNPPWIFQGLEHLRVLSAWLKEEPSAELFAPLRNLRSLRARKVPTVDALPAAPLEDVLVSIRSPADVRTLLDRFRALVSVELHAYGIEQMTSVETMFRDAGFTDIRTDPTFAWVLHATRPT
jgi:uncharacterized protein (TIGR02996 family)